ncbi:MAG: hypothetical protein PHE61_04305 [Candidatus Omnitrophica bacterium]|nr:hypothetical protein [Candidatus Omnitrophota bacterium]
MKTKLASLLLFFMFFLAVCPLIALAESSDEYTGAYNYSGSYDEARETSSNSSAFDGGSGSTYNTSSSSYPVGDVPDVGDSGPVGYYDESGNYHSN